MPTFIKLQIKIMELCGFKQLFNELNLELLNILQKSTAVCQMIFANNVYCSTQISQFIISYRHFSALYYSWQTEWMLGQK